MNIDYLEDYDAHKNLHDARHAHDQHDKPHEFNMFLPMELD